MRRASFFIAAIIIIAGVFPARGADYFQQWHHTTIRVKLDNERKWITGTQNIVYVNASPDTLREFWLHLYPNAFRNKNTVYQKDKNRQYNAVLRDIPKDHRGWLDLSDMKVNGAAAEVRVDDTLARIALASPLLPGDTLRLDFAFDGKVRKAVDRSGYRGDHYDMAQWYPKVVTYDENGFHLDKFATGEFYGEFGNFDVHIELPAHFVVAGTGMVMNGDAGWDYNPPKQPNAPRREKTKETKVVHFHAEQVHDFAWCADPSYVVQDTTWNGIEVRSVYRRSSAKAWEDSTLAHAVRALEWLDRRIGRYPYPQATVCEMLRTGGMEYPMFVMNGRASDGLVVHEFAHIYFFGILGNNERTEAWIDEGMATAQSRWYLESVYGKYGNRSRLNWYQRMTPQYTLAGEARRKIFDLHRRGYDERVSFNSTEYKHSYRLNVYDKASLVYGALRNAAGDSLFDASINAFYERWKFKHVNEDRLRAAFEGTTQRDLTRPFEQWLHTRKTVDYDLTRMRSRPDSNGVTTEIEIRRIGELYCPIDVVFELENGTSVTKRFDARDRSMRHRVSLPAKPRRATINPDNEIFDVDMTNNVSPRKRDLQFDWPNNAYYPEDAYQIRWRPGAWYNDVDGAKLGLHLRGSKHGWKHRAQVGVYYGVESDVWDFSASIAEPFTMFGSNGTLSASGFKMEGRADWKLKMEFVRRTELLKPPTTTFVAGYGYHELRDPVYLTSPEIYDTSQADTGPFFGFSIEPQIDVATVRFGADFRMGRDWFAGNYDYEHLATSLTIHSRPEVANVDLRVRLFGGFAGGGVPTSRKFNLAGAGPIAAGERFWLRAPGAVPDDLHYLEPGDGNLRGYAAGTFGVNRLFATNVELARSFRLPGALGKVHTVIGRPSLVGFFDVGWIIDSENPLAQSARVASLVEDGVLDAALQDAGVGIRSSVAWPFWNFTWRFDVPFWVSNPEVNAESDKLDWRYLFSLNATF